MEGWRGGGGLSLFVLFVLQAVVVVVVVQSRTLKPPSLSNWHPSTYQPPPTHHSPSPPHLLIYLPLFLPPFPPSSSSSSSPPHPSTLPTPSSSAAALSSLSTPSNSPPPPAPPSLQHSHDFFIPHPSEVGAAPSLTLRPLSLSPRNHVLLVSMETDPGRMSVIMTLICLERLVTIINTITHTHTHTTSRPPRALLNHPVIGRCDRPAARLRHTAEPRDTFMAFCVCGCGSISRVEGDGSVNTTSPAARGTTSQRIQRLSENRVNKTFFSCYF